MKIIHHFVKIYFLVSKNTFTYLSNSSSLFVILIPLDNLELFNLIVYQLLFLHSLYYCYYYYILLIQSNNFFLNIYFKLVNNQLKPLYDLKNRLGLPCAGPT
ncbi:hypothetical protein AAZX31_07G087000 [Glycine max]